MGAPSRVGFDSQGCLLEGILDRPQSAPGAAAVVCHPHPLYGGNMHNNIVQAVCSALVSHGWVTLRFNFRGVGNSAGHYAGHEPARDDTCAALDYFTTIDDVQALPIATVGYSFGSWAALNAGCNDERVLAVVGISPPVGSMDFGFLTGCLKPKLLVAGARDEYVEPETLAALAKGLPEPKQVLSFPGADHFWLTNESRLAAAIADYLEAAISPRQQL